MWQLCLAPQWHSSHNEYFWWNPSVYVVQKSLCSLKRTQRFLHCTEKSTAQSSEWRESHFSLGLDCMSKKMSNKYIFFLFLPTLFVSSLLVFLSWKLLHQNFLTFLWNQCFIFWLFVLVRDYSVFTDSLSGCELPVASFRRRWECEYLRTFFSDE